MIGKLKGIIDSYGEDFIVLDVGGVGYLVHCSARTLRNCPAPASRRRWRSRPTCARTRSGCSGSSPTASANGSACCRPCRAWAPRWRSPCSARSSRPISPPPSPCATRRWSRARRGRAEVAGRIVTELKDKAPSYSGIDPAIIRLSGAIDDARAAAGRGRGFGARQSRLWAAAGGRRGRRRRATPAKARMRRD